MTVDRTTEPGDAFRRRLVEGGTNRLLVSGELDGRGVRDLLDVCAGLKLTFRALPDLREIVPDDLIRRATPVPLEDDLPDAIGDGSAVVTGAAGTIGAETCEQLLAAGAGSLVLLDRDARRLQLAHQTLSRRFAGRTILAEPLDIRDRDRLRSTLARHRPRLVIHAAAEKVVPELESTPCLAAATNVIGTRHLVEATEACDARRFVYVSTDKAVLPSSVMGASKRVGEEIVRAAAPRSRTRFAVVRLGNVIGSSRSVVPLFLEQIASGGPITVTHPEVERYFMTRGEAVRLILRAVCRRDGELFVLDMGEPIRILDLARQLVVLAGLVPEVELPIRFVGLRPGEKLHEDLLSPEERAVAAGPGLFSVSAPRPAAGLERILEELDRAVRSEDDARARELLFDRARSGTAGAVDDSPTHS